MPSSSRFYPIALEACYSLILNPLLQLVQLQNLLSVLLNVYFLRTCLRGVNTIKNTINIIRRLRNNELCDADRIFNNLLW